MSYSVIFSNRSVISWSCCGPASARSSRTKSADDGYGAGLNANSARQLPQRAVDDVLADGFLQPVHHQRSLLVMNVLLVLDPVERQLLDDFAAAAAQVAVELALQELADLLLP
jgi:hypothetical protein